jgi:hypothetical protein
VLTIDAEKGRYLIEFPRNSSLSIKESSSHAGRGCRWHLGCERLLVDVSEGSHVYLCVLSKRRKEISLLARLLL